MEERKNKKTNSVDKMLLTVITDTTIRGIIKAANELEIKRDNIVSLFKENGQFVLIYYK